MVSGVVWRGGEALIRRRRSPWEKDIDVHSPKDGSFIFIIMVVLLVEKPELGFCPELEVLPVSPVTPPPSHPKTNVSFSPTLLVTPPQNLSTRPSPHLR